MNSVLLVCGAVALWAVPTYLMLAYLFKRIRQGAREKPGARWYFITAAIALFSLAWVFVLLAVLSAIAYWGYTSILNYHGYCTWGDKVSRTVPVEHKGAIQSCTVLPAEDLRGRRFTTEERLDIAINHYLCNQFDDYYLIGKAEGIGGLSTFFSMDDVKKHFTLIPYSSKDEFLRENPDCCKLTWEGSEGYDFPFLETGYGVGNGRADGVGDGMFDFKHKVRYMTQDRIRNEIEGARYITINNCGYPRYGSP